MGSEWSLAVPLSRLAREKPSHPAIAAMASTAASAMVRDTTPPADRLLQRRRVERRKRARLRRCGGCIGAAERNQADALERPALAPGFGVGRDQILDLRLGDQMLA